MSLAVRANNRANLQSPNQSIQPSNVTSLLENSFEKAKMVGKRKGKGMMLHGKGFSVHGHGISLHGGRIGAALRNTYSPMGEGVHLTPAQKVHLVRGGSVRISGGSLHGKHRMHLNRGQHNRLKIARDTGGDYDLKMTGPQIVANAAGGGWFGDVFDKIKDAGSAVFNKVKNVAQDLYNDPAGTLNSAADTVGNTIGSVLNNPLVKFGLEHGPGIASSLMGGGLKKGKKRKGGSIAKPRAQRGRTGNFKTKDFVMPGNPNRIAN